MGEAIRHRGPDAHGSYLTDSVGLHHRRLSIIDLSDAGTQPMHSACGRYTLVFNGEIYNFLELREELQNDGYTFATKTDTEVILALYSRHGRQCLDSLNGMFAFALWDNQAKSLFLARDRVGKKPLYYTMIDGDIAFASELKALLKAQLVERKIRLDALHDFFAYQYVPDPKTIFEDVFKLEPGHWMAVNQSGAESGQYWDVSFQQGENTDENSAAAALREHINAATRRRMIADVPLGAFLSGGVDSSGIVATMAKNSDRPVTTCAIGFNEKRFNETEFAEAVARQYQTDHHEFVVHEQVNDHLKTIAAYFDEPFADPSLVPTYFVSKLARQQVTVALAGDGGDEVFAGYEKYAMDALENRWRERTPNILRTWFFPKLIVPLSHSSLRPLRRIATLLKALSVDPAMAFYLSNAQITDSQWGRLASASTQQQLGGYHPSQQTVDRYQQSDGADHLARILYTDIKTYLPGDILVKVDRMSMAHSLEVRAPLLDYQLVEFACSLPSTLKLRNGEKKHLLKKCFKSDLPDDILYRKKMGFSPPLAQWFRNELRSLTETTVLGAQAGVAEYFSLPGIKQLWSEHQAETHDHGAVLWSLLMFQLWWLEYMDNDQAA
ncbi:asparagine synthase [gamma proteobacterium NOR5-3]|nr:asparagine synthase [gamma proteobacterium NOR5-3]